MISAKAIRFAVGDFRLGEISLELPLGEYFVILGSPGSGKSLFLECLCGLNRIDSGRIIIGGRDVTDLEPCDRGIGYVPQDYALFPHLSVAQNIGFGLRARGLPPAKISEKVGGAADQLGIGHLLDRWPSGLSGGEKQRVALARALVVDPKILLLDEPVSALDEALRAEVCLELKRVQRETGTTTIHVCHNFEETRIVADRVGLLRAGRLVQVGTPGELFDRPADTEAARFLRVGNVLSGEAERCDQLTRITLDGLSIYAVKPACGPVSFAIRADRVLVTFEPPATQSENCLEAQVVSVSPRDPYVRVEATVAPATHLVAFATLPMNRLALGSRVYVSFPASAVHILAGEGS